MTVNETRTSDTSSTPATQAVPETFTRRELQVTRISDGHIARRVDVTGWSERRVTNQIGGMLINADTDRWIIRDTDWDRPLPPSEERSNG